MANLGETDTRETVPRGRHAPPLEVRLGVQRRRLLSAAGAVFARCGYAEASAEAISREAGMSKATFYEHFANKEVCILALFDDAAREVLHRMNEAARDAEFETYEDRVRGGTQAFLLTLARHPESAQTLLVEIIGAGPHATERRDAILEAFAEYICHDNAEHAPRYGQPTFCGRDDAFAVIGAIVELVSRQLRTGEPANLIDLEPIIARVFLGTLSMSQT